MTTKLKLISISLALFLIVALSAALAFALPKEEFNLSGSLSYEPSYKTYRLSRSFPAIESDSYLRIYNDGTVEMRLSMPLSWILGSDSPFLPVTFVSEDKGVVESSGEISFNGVFMAGDSYFENMFTTDKWVAGNLLYGSHYPLLSSTLHFLNENVIYGDQSSFLIKEGIDPEEIVFVGNPEANIALGCDLFLPIQTTPLEGEALKSAFVGKNSIEVYNGFTYETVEISELTFKGLDQQTKGIQTVEVSFLDPFGQQQTLTEKIKVMVYENEEEVTYYQIGDWMSGVTLPAISAESTVEDFILALNEDIGGSFAYEKYVAGEKDYNSTVRIESITPNMISDFKIEGENGTCKLTYESATATLGFKVCQEGEYMLYPDALAEMAVLGAEGAASDPLEGLRAYLETDPTNVLTREDLTVEYFVDGVPTTLEEIISTGGLKTYQIKVSLKDGTLVEEVDMTSFVCDSENRFPTSFEYVGFEYLSEIPELEDGSLDLEGKYIRICYNGKQVEVGQEEGFIKGVDYEDIYLTDERVKITYFESSWGTYIVDAYITFEFGGKTYDLFLDTTWK